MAEKAQYAKPASQLDLEARLESGNESDRVVSTADTFKGAQDDGKARTYVVEDNDTSGYIGTSGEYVTYANDTEKPVIADDSVEDQIAKEFAENQQVLAQVTPVETADTPSDEKEADPSKEAAKPAAKSTTSSTGKSGS